MGNTAQMVKLTIDNSNIMSSYEKASLSITSPTGKTITIYKRNINRFNVQEVDVFWKFCKDPMVKFQGVMEASIEEMRVLLELSRK